PLRQPLSAARLLRAQGPEPHLPALFRLLAADADHLCGVLRPRLGGDGAPDGQAHGAALRRRKGGPRIRLGVRRPPARRGDRGLHRRRGAHWNVVLLSGDPDGGNPLPRRRAADPVDQQEAVGAESGTSSIETISTESFPRTREPLLGHPNGGPRLRGDDRWVRLDPISHGASDNGNRASGRPLHRLTAVPLPRKRERSPDCKNQLARRSGIGCDSRASSVSTSPASSGGENRKPCTSLQPCSRTALSCSSVSTPSAVVDMPSEWPSPITALMMARLSPRLSRSRMNERSILILSNGNARR